MKTLFLIGLLSLGTSDKSQFLIYEAYVKLLEQNQSKKIILRLRVFFFRNKIINVEKWLWLKLSQGGKNFFFFIYIHKNFTSTTFALPFWSKIIFQQILWFCGSLTDERTRPNSSFSPSESLSNADDMLILSIARLFLNVGNR